jgi:hypothetical protein
MDSQKKKQCPYCGEEILAIAKKCKHCGEFLNTSLKHKRSQEPQKVKGEGCFLQTMNAGCMLIVMIIVVVFLVGFCSMGG